ncbi:uncharacterized protein [Littorina saxatilis]|uniref:uncharacterized protein n=1 Tax=Littorina saxatilis TaxID=31220 RepID=UPI0038B495BD
MITSIVQVSLPSPRSTARLTRSAASSKATSVRTSSSKQWSVSSQRIKVAAEAAALKTKLQAKLEENQNLDEIEHADRRLSQLKRKLAQQQLETQIKMEEVKLEVFEQELQKYFHTTNCHSQSNLNVQDELQSQLGQDHASYMTQSHVNQSHHHRPSQTRSHLTDATAREPYPNESLIETLSQAIGASRLPIPEPPVFTGDPLLYPDWKASFSALIEGKGIPASDKIHYLKRYLGGSAREAVSGFFLLGSEKAYQQAKDILDQRFGNQFITSDAFMSELNSWPKIQNKDKSALQKFSDFLVQCQAAQQEFPILRSLDDIKKIQKIAQKLPDWASTRWNRVVAMKRKDKGRYPTFAELSSFVKDEADIANDPALLSGPQILQSVTNRQDKGESVNKRVFFTNGDLSQDCKFCKRKNHNLADCRSFARKNMEERREFVMKERLCFGFLNPGHMSKQCRNRRLLIGYNCPQALAPLQCITGDARQPFAIETCLGWSVIGGSPPQVEPFDAVGQSHRSVTKAVAYTGLVTHVYKTQVQEVTTSELLHLMERDFTDHDTQKMSQDDHLFLRILTEGIHRMSDGFYEMPLPFKQENPDLLNNRQGALHRALALQKQLLKRPMYKEHYMSFMEDLIESGEAEKIPQEDIHPSNSVWYIPHHGVYHPEKPNRVRVVFDCSARYHGTSLNDLLLQGPDLINPLRPERGSPKKRCSRIRGHAKRGFLSHTKKALGRDQHPD